MVAACLPIDDKIRIPAACALRQTDRQGLVSCAAAAFLDPGQRRILACAISSQSYFELGVCLSGIAMNSETATFVKCAGSSGGEPDTIIICTAGQLTETELQKCKNGIGTSNGCFGPSNTIVSYFGGLDNALVAAAIPYAAVFLASVKEARTVSEATAGAITDIKDGLVQCANDATHCPSTAVDYCKRNPAICLAGIPIPGNPIPPIHLPNAPTPTQVVDKCKEHPVLCAVVIFGQ